jgi:hypothetical protein
MTNPSLHPRARSGEDTITISRAVLFAAYIAVYESRRLLDTHECPLGFAADEARRRLRMAFVAMESPAWEAMERAGTLPPRFPDRDGARGEFIAWRRECANDIAKAEFDHLVVTPSASLGEPAERPTLTDGKRWRALVNIVEENSRRVGLGGGVVLWHMDANEHDRAHASIQTLDHENPRQTLRLHEAASLAEALDAWIIEDEQGERSASPSVSGSVGDEPSATPYFGCFTGDCPHQTQAECDAAIKAEFVAQESELTALRADRDRLRAEMRELRESWWLSHGCSFGALYGDDGEMNCGNCLADFKRLSGRDIAARLRNAALLRRSSSPSSATLEKP